MKREQFNYSRVGAVIVVGSMLACSIAWIRPFHEPDGGKAKSTATTVPAKEAAPAVSVPEETMLVQRLENDGLISEVKGFTVEKDRNTLSIDGKQLPADVAAKYLSSLKQEEIRVHVFSFMERLKQHPDASFMQILLPVSMSSPCVDTKPKKEGC